jgi:class 3 adenylate cyclase
MVEARVERRLAAILAADVAGYSRLMRERPACQAVAKYAWGQRCKTR